MRTVLAKRDEPWLIVHHKPGRGVPDIQAYLRRVLKDEVFNRLKFVNWGKHRATNDFRDITNIILAGTLFLRPSHYRATKHVSTGIAVVDRSFTKAEMQTFELGEHANDILQALCRGAVRKSEGDTCPECHAYIIASVRSGIPQALPAIFPDCKVAQWMPKRQTLNGLAAKAFKAIRLWSERAEPGSMLKFKDLAVELGVTASTLKDVRKREDFASAVSSLGVTPWGPNVYFSAYRKE